MSKPNQYKPIVVRCEDGCTVTISKPTNEYFRVVRQAPADRPSWMNCDVRFGSELLAVECMNALANDSGGAWASPETKAVRP